MHWIARECDTDLRRSARPRAGYSLRLLKSSLGSRFGTSVQLCTLWQYHEWRQSFGLRCGFTLDGYEHGRKAMHSSLRPCCDRAI